MYSANPGGRGIYPRECARGLFGLFIRDVACLCGHAGEGLYKAPHDNSSEGYDLFQRRLSSHTTQNADIAFCLLSNTAQHHEW